MNRGNIDPPITWTWTEATLIVLTHGQERRQYWPPIKAYTLIWTEVTMTPDHIHIDMNIGNIDGPNTWAWTRVTLTLPTYEHEQRQHWYPNTYTCTWTEATLTLLSYGLEQRQHWSPPPIHTHGHEQRQHCPPKHIHVDMNRGNIDTPQHMDMKSSNIDAPKKPIHNYYLWPG
jgi:hypothetical protein